MCTDLRTDRGGRSAGTDPRDRAQGDELVGVGHIQHLDQRGHGRFGGGASNRTPL